METSQEITDLLLAWERGDQSALEKLIPLVEGELRHIAKGYMRHERPGHILQTTALVNEAYVKLIAQDRVHWKNRSHFFAIAAQCMRRVLIDYAKNRLRAKRGGDRQQIQISDAVLMSEVQSEELLELDEALQKLAIEDNRKVKVVELRYFCGFDMKETAELLNVSEATVARDWRLARAWLRRELRANGPI
jgi:RNA polymerase sigma factor (TIGR02999 family)